MNNSDGEKKLEKFFNKTSEDEKKKSYRSKLIHTLGDDLSVEDKLYATVERNIEDILYPTMQDFNPKKKLSLLDNALIMENYGEENLKNGVSWIRPLKMWHMTSKYGWRIHPTLHYKKWHDGIDLRASLNTPVYAVADGKIIYNGWYNGYGKYIEIDHGGGISSFYGHLNSSKVFLGDEVKQGQEIALSGNTAGIGKNGIKMSTAAHLHFGVHKNGKDVNPLEFF